MAWYKVTNETDLNHPFMKKVKAGGKEICLVCYEGDLYAVSAKCPHAGADLSRGWCVNSHLVCPYHRYTYDLQTGKGAPGQFDYLSTYNVKVEEDGIYIKVNSWLNTLKNTLFK